MSSITGFNQFEYFPLNFDANNSDFSAFSYQNRIYNIDRDNILREIDENSGVINEYSIHTGFPIRGNAQPYQIDSFLVILNGERSALEHSGALVYNMNSKERQFFSWTDYLQDFAGSAYDEFIPGVGLINFPGPVSVSLSHNNISVGEENLYIFRQSYVDSTPMLLQLNPVTGFQKIELNNLANMLMSDERVYSFGCSESVMVVYTNLGRIIFWDMDNQNNVSIKPYALAETPYFYDARKHRFPFVTTSGIQGVMDTTGVIRNFTDEFNLPASSVTYGQYVSDSLCLVRQQDNLLIIIDTTESIKTNKYLNALNLPGEIYALGRVDDDKSLLLKMHIWPAAEYHPSLYKLERNETITPYVTTPLKNIRDYYQSYKYINRNNEIFQLGFSTYAINKDGEYKQYLLQDEVLKQVSGNNLTVHRYFLGEDEFGNVYGEVSYHYDNSFSHLDTSYFLKVNARTYEYSMILRAEFDSVLYQKGTSTLNVNYTVKEGKLIQTSNAFTNVIFYSIAGDSIQKVCSVGEKVFVTSFNTIYQLNKKEGTFRKIQSFVTDYPLYRPSYDVMGNIYIETFPPYIGARLYKMAFNDSVFYDVLPDATANVGTGRLMHNWSGDIYIARTYKNYYSSIDDNTRFTFYNGFEWDSRNSLKSNLPFDANYYAVRTSPHATRVILETTQARNVDLICPTRELDEIESVYYLRDSTLPAEISVNSDIKDVIWSNSTDGLATTFYVPGKHWVKVLFDNGCSKVKEFEVKLLPTENNEKVDVLYDFNSNPFPLIFDDGINGDLFVYDLKGSQIKYFKDYQNEWLPAIKFKNSVMVYAIYQGEEIIQSGKIIFL